MEISINQNGWAITRLEDIATRITKGGTPTTYGYSFQTSGINFIKVENVENGRVVLKSITDFIGDDAHIFQSKSQLSANDILFSIAGTIGETCVVREDYLPANTNQAFAIIKGTDCAIVPKLLELQLEAFVAKVKLKARGGAMNNVSLEDLKNLLVYIPPVAEQHRIIAKIEELFSSLDKGIESLKTAQAQLKVYRQAVLKWAFEGKLTNKNVKDGELPEGWEWIEVGKVCDCIVPNRDKPKTFTGNIKWITTPNLSETTIRLDYKNVQLGLTENETKEYNARVIPIGSVIMTCVGNFGLSAIVEQPIVINQQLHAFLPNEKVNPKFLAYCIYIHKNYFEKKSTSTTIQYLNKSNCNSMPFLLCQISEQTQIVAEIESRLSVCDKIEESICTSLLQAEALRQSILKKAFEGKLVAQDPNDEPASVLLERIKAEREKNKPAKKVKEKKVIPQKREKKEILVNG